MRSAPWAVVMLLGVRAGAGPADEARKLFVLGQQEIEANQVDAACNSFATSLQLDPEIGTRLNLADCREQQGRLVEAYQLFAASIDEAARTHKEGRERFARERAAALAARLVKVKLTVAAPAPAGLTITIAGRALPAAEWSRVQVVAPGAIAVTATAPDRERFHTSVTGAAGREVVIDVPSLAAPDVTAEPPEPVAPPPAEQRTAPPPPAGPRDRTPFYVGGAGCALVIASFGLGLHAKSRYDTAYDHLDASGVRSAQTEADVGTGVAIAGLAAVAVGVVLYVRDRDHHRDRTAMTPVFDRDSVGIAVGGPL